MLLKTISRKILLLSTPLILLPVMLNAQTKPFPVSIRDFNVSAPDFSLPKTCNTDGGGLKGLVQTTLGTDRKPVDAPGSPCPTYKISEWFHDVSGLNKRYCQELILDKVPNTLNTYTKDDPIFFPIDMVKIPPSQTLVKAPNPTNEAVTGETFKGDDGQQHNFHFCMEMHATFKYRGGEVLNFKGDDDVWVFVNNTLALDLGGRQNNGQGLINLDNQKNQLNIALDNYYNFDFFFCERQATGSHLQVTTSFDLIPSTIGLQLADKNGNAIPSGDTVTVIQGGGSKDFFAYNIHSVTQTIDCDNVASQKKDPITGTWTLGSTPLLPGTQTLVPDNSPSGIQKLTFTSTDPANPGTTVIYVKIIAQKIAKPIKGYYQDLNGDGRIETAVLIYDTATTTTPKVIKLTDPFNKASVAIPTPTAPVNKKVTVTLTTPFSYGTNFDNNQLLANVDDISVPMDDSVGPLVKSAKAVPSLDSKVPSTIEITFSEPVNIDLNSKAFPFDVKRNNGLVNGAEISIAKVELIAPGQYRYTFAADSKKYPLPNDSLRVTVNSGLKDTKGNLSKMQIFVPIGGEAATAIAEVDLGIVKGLTESVDLNLKPIDSVIVIHNNKGACLNCTNPQIQSVLPTNLKSGLVVDATVGPTWRVNTKYPFSYSIKIFDNLGTFVNKADGEINAAQFAQIRAMAPNPNDSIPVYLTFLPIARDGNAIGTGAYIMKGTISVREQPGQITGSQGEVLSIKPKSKNIVSRFGFIRNK